MALSRPQLARPSHWPTPPRRGGGGGARRGRDKAGHQVSKAVGDLVQNGHRTPAKPHDNKISSTRTLHHDPRPHRATPTFSHNGGNHDRTTRGNLQILSRDPALCERAIVTQKKRWHWPGTKESENDEKRKQATTQNKTTRKTTNTPTHARGAILIHPHPGNDCGTRPVMR